MAPKPKNPIVSQFLRNTHYKLLKDAGVSLDCAVCLSTVLNCKDCYALLVCGHSFHMGCLIDVDVCPLCRK